MCCLCFGEGAKGAKPRERRVSQLEAFWSRRPAGTLTGLPVPALSLSLSPLSLSFSPLRHETDITKTLNRSAVLQCFAAQNTTKHGKNNSDANVAFSVLFSLFSLFGEGRQLKQRFAFSAVRAVGFWLRQRQALFLQNGLGSYRCFCLPRSAPRSPRHYLLYLPK